MSRRRRVAKAVPPAVAVARDQLPLWPDLDQHHHEHGHDNGPAIEAGRTALARAEATHAAAIAALVPLARQLARNAGTMGITVSDLRMVAADLGLLPTLGRGRALSFLGAVMERAGLVPTGKYRRSAVEQSHGNLHAVFRAPDCRDTTSGTA